MGLPTPLLQLSLPMLAMLLPLLPMLDMLLPLLPMLDMLPPLPPMLLPLPLMLLPLLLMAMLDMLDIMVLTKFVFNIVFLSRPKKPSQPRQWSMNQRSLSPSGAAETTCDNENLQSDHIGPISQFVCL